MTFETLGNISIPYHAPFQSITWKNRHAYTYLGRNICLQPTNCAQGAQRDRVLMPHFHEKTAVFLKKTTKIFSFRNQVKRRLRYGARRHSVFFTDVSNNCLCIY